MAASQTQRTPSKSRTNTSTTRKKTNTTGKKSNGARTTSSRQSTVKKNTVKNQSNKKDVDYKQRSGMYDEIQMIAALALAVLMLLSIYDFCGVVGHYIAYFLFGMFGWLAYVLPYILFFGTAFYISNRHSRVALIKFLAAVILCISAMTFMQMLSNPGDSTMTIPDYYTDSAVYKNGGGMIGGILCKLLYPLFGTAGTYLIVIAIFLIGLVLIAEKAVFKTIAAQCRTLWQKAVKRHQERKEMLEAAREEARLEAEAYEEDYDDIEDEDDYTDIDEYAKVVPKKPVKPATRRKKRVQPAVSREPEEELEPELIPAYGLELKPISFEIPKLDERILKAAAADAGEDSVKPLSEQDLKRTLPDITVTHMEPIPLEGAVSVKVSEPQMFFDPEYPNDHLEDTGFEFTPDPVYFEPDVPTDIEAVAASAIEATDPLIPTPIAAGRSAEVVAAPAKAAADNRPEELKPEEIVPPVKEYIFPPMDLLKKGKPSKAAAQSDAQLKETAMKLQSTLDSFGVKVQVTNVSCGPSVTRYELSPELGVKVSRIVALADDIKLNLAVSDIRIEAPIPGKAAVGIEVPNKENTTVMLRDLLESNEFKKNPSGIAFAAGRDIGGQVIIADIARMPHLLIAGATGSGKSVCINTLIMSIIYKSKPEDVRMIMVDPKVVELSVYNGIPHLMIPVVTDPKKAAGALNWGVMEMDNRYKKFAELGVRDLKSYNAKIEGCEYESEEHQKLPQIVIIVDELADLMMVAPGEVEDAICRLAQLARAAGIHLVIATQRPSVNVITGLIKANVPSRIAFSVSSGVDSRTIIDMNGAEKLLGKGDMLFYPTGYQKPLRVQGAFVSDTEVNAVVDFITDDAAVPHYNEDIVNTLNTSKGADAPAASDRDAYFAEAGKFIIEKDKASIGMLQRVYKIGFNRAARIMDQLSEAGVVGPEEGTKPRKVLMTPEEFERYIEDYI